MIKFILNDKQVEYNGHPGTVMLDFVRYTKNMSGTKIGCREGDCGACTVLVGGLFDDQLRYRSMTSCLMPMANANGKHIVTVEGLNMAELNPIQQAMSDEGATQCGFCTPGFVVSLAGFCLRSNVVDYRMEALRAVDGNICRCTGYKSIQRAVEKIADLCARRKTQEVVSFVVKNKILPDYFQDIKEKLALLQLCTNNIDQTSSPEYFVGGGTDLYVQKHDTMSHSESKYLFNRNEMKAITEKDGICHLGSAITVTDLIESPIIRKAFPDFEIYYKLVSSTPIRNMATIAGNLINASPIGDFTAFFLALDSTIVLSNGISTREIKLKEFYLGYKKLDKQPNDFVSGLFFQLPKKNSKFNFEKVCKRTNLDIASVNTAMHLEFEGDVISNASISAGGVGPIPMFLKKSSQFLIGKNVSVEMIESLLTQIQSEIAPISDARGTEDYKRLLLNQLVKAHFSIWYPNLLNAEFVKLAK